MIPLEITISNSVIHIIKIDSVIDIKIHILISKTYSFIRSFQFTNIITL